MRIKTPTVRKPTASTFVPLLCMYKGVFILRVEDKGLVGGDDPHRVSLLFPAFLHKYLYICKHHWACTPRTENKSHQYFSPPRSEHLCSSRGGRGVLLPSTRVYGYHRGHDLPLAKNGVTGHLVVTSIISLRFSRFWEGGGSKRILFEWGRGK